MNQIYNPKVSIIIIGYNIESYLDKCLESVFHQTYTNYEAIFVNDGSQDGTIHVAKKYSEKYGLHIIDKQNGGIVSARKAGLAYATGEYVAFVDGDDWLNNHMVTSLVDALDKGMRDADIVCSNFNWQTEEGDFIVQTNKVDRIGHGNLSFFSGIMSNDIDHHMFPKLYRRQFLIDCGYAEYLNVTMAEDLMTNALLGLHNPQVVYSTDVNYFYRYNTSSVIRKGNKKLLEQIDTLCYMQQKIEKTIYNEDIRRLMEYQWFSYAMGYIKRPGDFDIKQRIFYESKKHFGDIEHNQYVQQEMKETQGRYVRLFYSYHRHEMIAQIHDKVLFSLLAIYKSIRRRVRRNK